MLTVCSSFSLCSDRLVTSLPDSPSSSAPPDRPPSFLPNWGSVQMSKPVLKLEGIAVLGLQLGGRTEGSIRGSWLEAAERKPRMVPQFGF